MDLGRIADFVIGSIIDLRFAPADEIHLIWVMTTEVGVLHGEFTRWVILRGRVVILV